MSKPKAQNQKAITRQAAEAKGRSAERWAAVWLRLRGYRIVARNFRTPHGEIDIIARRGDLLCFIEVKARASETLALDAVTRRQRQRIEMAARRFLAARPDLAHLGVRLDVMAVMGAFNIRLVADAWRPEAP